MVKSVKSRRNHARSIRMIKFWKKRKSLSQEKTETHLNISSSEISVGSSTSSGFTLMTKEMTVLNPISDEDTEENLDLDLHVSDTEEYEVNDDIQLNKKCGDIPMEIEEEILNKFDSENTLEKSIKESCTSKPNRELSKSNEEKMKTEESQLKEGTFEEEDVPESGDVNKNEVVKDKIKVKEKVIEDKSSKAVVTNADKDISNDDNTVSKIDNVISNEETATTDQQKDNLISKGNEQGNNEVNEISSEKQTASLQKDDVNKYNEQKESEINKVQEKDVSTHEKNNVNKEITEENKECNNTDGEEKSENVSDINYVREQVVVEDNVKDKCEPIEEVLLQEENVNNDVADVNVFLENKVNPISAPTNDVTIEADTTEEDMEIDETDGVGKLLEVSKKIEDKQGIDENKPPSECEEDLLLVMDEKNADADETDFPDEDDTKEDGNKTDKENLSPEEESNEETAGGQDEDVMDIEEVIDEIDIEEHNAAVENGTEIFTNDEQIVSMQAAADLEDVAQKDSIKDTVKLESKTDILEADSVLKTILISGKEGGIKRQLSDPESIDDVSKKIKLETKNFKLKKLEIFKQFMLDKSLKGITRDQIEMLCIQKMCECILQKSEIGELKLKIRSHEQLIDSLRKEAVLLSKQTRDVHIVHQKVANDIAKMQEKSDKPLIVPKITRSVGLQAVVREELRRRLMKSPVPIKTSVRKVTPIAPASGSSKVLVSKPTIINRTSPVKALQTTPLLRVVSPMKKLVTATTVNTPPKTGEVGKGVIDLTDEDDNKVIKIVGKPNGTNVTNITQNGTKVNMINAPNGHKFVVMPNGQTVMVKLATPPHNIVVSQPLRGVQTSPVNGMVRAVGANTVRPIGSRPRAPVGQFRARPVVSTPTKIVKHPAPLPAAPPSNPDVYSLKPIPPRPNLMLNKTTCGTGIILSWKMPYKLDMFEDIASYQLYAYQETKSQPKTDSWGKIGDVKALELPMAVTLTQFAVGNRYYFAVRAVDVLSRYGPFSDYQTILL